MGKPIWGKWANNHDSAQQQAYIVPQNLEWRKSVKQLWDMGSASLAAAHLPAHLDHDNNTPPEQRAEGYKGAGLMRNKKLQQTMKNTFGPGTHFPDDQSIRI